MSFISRGVILCRFTGYAAVFSACLIASILRADSDLFQGPIGPHHRTWTSDSAIDLSAPTLNQVSGAKPNQTVHRVVEISPGMHYWDGERWGPSVPSFSISNNTFIAFQVQHPVRILANLNRRSAVCVRTPDGQLLETTPAGIGLYDAASGRSTIIGKLKNCAGTLVGTNQVWFQDAYDGIDADVVYTIERQSLEQDIVITGHIDPADWGFPTNTTRIQVFTEFYDNHKPDHLIRPLRIERNDNVRTNMAMPDLVDDFLGFGELTFVTGRAFVARSEAYTNGVEAVVVKEFKTLGNRTFMIEQVEYPAIKKGLGALPKRQRHASTDTFKKSKTQYASIPSPLPAREQADTALPTSLTNRIQRLAKLEKLPVQGLVIDYVATLTSMSTPITFQGDTTYLVPSAWGPIYLNGMVTIEGGAVVKYQIGASLVINNVIVCKTTSHRPAIFTAVDDHAIGEPIGSGTLGQNRYANPAIQQMYPSVSTPLSNLRFCYAQQALSIQGPNTLTQTINHSQFVSCITGISLLQTGCGSGSCGALGLEVNNCLMDQVQYPIVGGTICGTPTYMVNLFNCTFDTATCFASGPSYGTLNANSVNCIYSQVSSLYAGNAYFYGNYNAFDSSPQFGNYPVSPNITPIFQTQGFGRHYLAAGINLRNGGTICGLSASLLAELQQRTVDPPTLMAGPITADTTWYPSKKTGPIPNIGYHYDTLDYILANTTLSATLTLSGGVAVGLPKAVSLSMQSGGRIVSEGTPLRPNRLVSLANVQEPSPTEGANMPTLMTLSSSSGSADLDFRFTDFSIGQGRLGALIDSGGNPFHRVSFRDCNLRDALVTLYPGSSAATSVGITNNLLHRCQLTLGQTSSSVTAPFTVYLYNNLCLGSPANTSALTLNYAAQYAASVWEIHDNLFDQASQSVSLAYPSYVNRSTNGFTSGTSTNLGGNGPTGFTITYQTGPLGDYYLPSSAPQLIDQGSRSADDAGLHHYTTTLAQSIEGTSQVDIGLHYMAMAVTASSSPTVWVDDSCPPGSSPAGEWIWTQSPAPTSGNLSHLLANYNDMHQDYFMYAAEPVYIAPGATLFCDVYVSSSYPPLEVMLQWCAEDATWWYHRAYWGQDQIAWTPRTCISSSVPTAGQWVTLNIPASAVDLGGRYISGMAFTLYNGSAAFDRAGFTTGSTIITPYVLNDSDGDGLPDYIEDRNGNGTVDAGETDWTVSNNGLSASGSVLQVFTPLK